MRLPFELGTPAFPAFLPALLGLAMTLSPTASGLAGNLPAPGTNKVAYYVFDSGGPDHFPLPTFTDAANIVVLFEGKLWELVDSVHYATGWMRNVNYHSYAEILRDVRTLQARGIKVLMNVDDTPSWSTDTVFTTYDGHILNRQQFAAFVKTCAIDSLHLDGISLDIEHKATGNAAYIALLTELGKYFGPLSSNASSQIYAAAIYAGSYGVPGAVIGKSRAVGSCFNFVMDMAYFNSNYTTRFNQWADSIGTIKTMIGVVNDQNTLAFATQVAAWQPASGPKAGIMVYAANNLKTYADAVFNALVVPTDVPPGPHPGVPQSYALRQNFPNPFNPSTCIRYAVPRRSYVTLAVFNTLGQRVAELVGGDIDAGWHDVQWDAGSLASGVYFCRFSAVPALSGDPAGTFVDTKRLLLVR